MLCCNKVAVINKHTAKLHHVGSLYILTYDARKIKHKKPSKFFGHNDLKTEVLGISFGLGVP
jgi:hypothetical protein